MDKLHTISKTELYRLQIMTQLAEKGITPKQVGELLGVSERHVKRIWRRFKLDGPEGLVNQSRGKPNHNRLSEEVKQQALDLVVER